MNSNWDQADEGQIHLHDRWQFELKSEFSPKPNKKTEYLQEFYLFIPNTLQINPQTYTKQQFYQDQTNLIRYKTPTLSLQQLLDESNQRSPLKRLTDLSTKEPNENNIIFFEDEIKLLANIIHGTLKRDVNHFITLLQDVEDDSDIDKLHEELTTFITLLKQLRKKLASIDALFPDSWKQPTIKEHISYIDEFISNSINTYLVHLIDQLRSHDYEKLYEIDKRVCIILKSENQRQERYSNKKNMNATEIDEYILYRHGLLNKFVLDSLLLPINRFSSDQKYHHWIEGFSAGIAMLVYLLLFIWQGEVFVFNSLPFVIITVFLYMLKDRMKDTLKALSYKQAFRWFADFTTEIGSASKERIWGVLKESFSFFREKDLPNNIVTIRNRDFHSILESFKRPEKIIYYKRIIKISKNTNPEEARRSSLNIIFRFNIHHFLTKASEPFEYYTTIDPQTLGIIQTRLPKVYHLNLIMQNTIREDNVVKATETKKFRIIIDKHGIKRIEDIEKEPKVK